MVKEKFFEINNAIDSILKDNYDAWNIWNILIYEGILFSFIEDYFEEIFASVHILMFGNPISRIIDIKKYRYSWIDYNKYYEQYLRIK
jgi:hypothetical protein